MDERGNRLDAKQAVTDLLTLFGYILDDKSCQRESINGCNVHERTVDLRLLRVPTSARGHSSLRAVLKKFFAINALKLLLGKRAALLDPAA